VGLLNELLLEPRWQGLRLIATDSTILRLPPWLENQTEFGVQTDIADSPMCWRAPWACLLPSSLRHNSCRQCMASVIASSNDFFALVCKWRMGGAACSFF